MELHDSTEKERLQAMAAHEAELGAISPEDVAVGSAGFHVALHTAYICHDTVSRHLLENATILSHPDLYELATRANDALGDLYQKFGEKLATES